ncbi:MAG: alpha-glucan family phosphorylase [Deinococcota bacterium]
MNILGHVTVLPHVPERIGKLEQLAYNVYWTWKPAARRLFRLLDVETWDERGHSPLKMLRDVEQHQLERAASDPDYLAIYDQVIADFEAYLDQSESWFKQDASTTDFQNHVYAYFCAEYGWHEAVALYSGGLGVLAGDHTKAASDLGVPLVAVGLWYPEGYFHQRVAADGSQEAIYERLAPSEMPFHKVTDSAGDELHVSVSLHGRDVLLRAWRLEVGSINVYLLDSDVDGNTAEDRNLLSRLYGGDQHTRIAQEIILGIGGVRLLRALDISPTSWHMNEGHSAFMALERCRELVQAGMNFEQAEQVVAASTVFTVHTPVAAGNDAFAFDLVSEFFNGYWGSLGLNQQEFHRLGRHDQGWGGVFSMPALALRFSRGRNGVAQLHGDTSRRIWRDLWPAVPTDEIPIKHITNGVHLKTWLAPEMFELLRTVLPADWQTRLDDADMWQAVLKLDNHVLWDVRKHLKAQSVRFLRRRVVRQYQRYGANPTALHNVQTLFNPEALTIGFARRFATYKRATLIFSDLDRLDHILNGIGKNVQLVFAGKAHPADQPGQALIETIQQLSKDDRFAGKILFVEDYDMAVGRALTRGTDVWLNNPRRPLEASGTSGQKAAMNGILNLSILDGWWPEGYDGVNGWAIGNEYSSDSDDDNSTDISDADSLYDLLEREVVPLYYKRDARDTPLEWLERAKQAIASVSPKFNAQRMVKDYVHMFYAPASERAAYMAADDYAAAAKLADWQRHINQNWHNVSVTADVMTDAIKRIGDRLEVTATVSTKGIESHEIRVELVYSREGDELESNLRTVPLAKVETRVDGSNLYRAQFAPEFTGRLIYGVRVYPVHDALPSPFDAHSIRWA